MGLLDYLPEDETKRSAALQGILATGLGMMANSYNPGGRFAPALAQGGMSGMQTYGNALENAQQQQVRQMQLEQMKQQQADAKALREFDPSKFYLTPQQQAVGRLGPTPQAAELAGTLQPKFDQRGMIAAMMQSGSPALKQRAMEMLTKESAPIKLGKDEQLLDPTTYKPLASNLVQDVKNGYLVPDGKGGWKVDQTLFAAEKELKATAAPRVSVSPTVKVGNTFGEGVAKAGADRLMGQVEAASSAPSLMGAANQIVASLDTGKVMAGPGTTWKVAAGQLFGGDTEKLTSTRATIQGLAKLSLQGRQSLKGQGSITDQEQQMLKDAESGNIDNLSVAEIRLIAEGAKKNAAFLHGQGKKAASALRMMPEFQSILPAFDIPDLPAVAPAAVGAPPPGSVRKVR